MSQESRVKIQGVLGFLYPSVASGGAAPDSCLQAPGLTRDRVHFLPRVLTFTVLEIIELSAVMSFFTLGLHVTVPTEVS